MVLPEGLNHAGRQSYPRHQFEGFVNDTARMGRRRTNWIADYDTRKVEIQKQLVAAAEEVGFFVVTDHGLKPEDIEAHFARAKRFFALPEETKRHYANPNTPKCNV